MSKAFVRESGDEEVDPRAHAEAPVPAKNYITPAGFARLKAELKRLVEIERPEVVRTVSWAASNGDRSENGDYLYGKKRLREIDRRVRQLIKRLESASVVDNSDRDAEQVFFGATARVRSRSGGERSVTIVGADEVDTARGRVSWISPVAKALLKARVGDVVTLATPAGVEQLEILDVSYLSID
ncbi:MAG: transcription elongation factor GreB [Betaproteobacteria bacterium]|nr:transcription elongation factor GreB [Betaproteobacteria bacterium]